MASIGIIATLTVSPGKEAEFEAILAELTARVHADEPGNLFYGGFHSPDNPQHYKVLEHYRDKAAADAHFETVHFKAAGEKLGACLAAPLHLVYLDGFA